MTVSAGIVIAGGRSLRMAGQDKRWALCGGVPLLTRVCHRLAGQVDKLAVGLQQPTKLPDLPPGTTILYDQSPGLYGPLGGIAAGLAWAREMGTGALTVIAGDMPFIPLDLVPILVNAASGPDSDRIILASSNGRLQMLAARWPVRYERAVMATLDSGQDLSVINFIRRHGFVAISFDSGGIDPFFNINTSRDLANANALLHNQATKAASAI